MQQYKPTLKQYLLMYFLIYLIVFGIGYFLSLILRINFAEYLIKATSFMIGYLFVAFLNYERQTIQIKDGQITGPGRRWKQLSFPVAKIDWERSGSLAKRKWGLGEEYIFSMTGDKILVHFAFTKEQRESLWQALQQAQTDVGN